jgi:4-hydroxybenzoate polyprenyltransferase
MASGRVGAALRLARVQTLALTALTPVIGGAVAMALAGMDPWSIRGATDLAFLFAVGACFHVYGFVLNEWADVEVDRASLDLAGKPLVSGRVRPRTALGAALAAGLVGLVPLGLVGLDVLPVALYSTGLVLGAAYDLWGKRAPLDLVLAGSLSALLLAGVTAVYGPAFPTGSDLALIAGIVALQFLQNLFQNAVEGGIKDVDHDMVAGARTLAVVTGTRIDDGVVRASRGFLAFAYGVKGVHLAVLVWMGLVVVRPDLGATAGVASVGLAVLGVGGMAFTMRRFLGDVRFDRADLKRSFSAHEMATYAATIAILLGVLGSALTVLLLALPIAWFLGSNIALYGRPLEPGV